MQRLKVNRHRPCLYRHYYLAVGFIVNKPCQTEVFQPIFLFLYSLDYQKRYTGDPRLPEIHYGGPTYMIFS